MKHIISAEQYDLAELEQLFEGADQFRQSDQDDESQRAIMSRYFGKTMASMFYEPSTRTRMSFGFAAKKLGIAVESTENAAEFSSAAKGESIEDTVRVFEEYNVDVISLRTRNEGEANRAATVCNVPIINGGDGKGEHPTQAALDVYTISREFGTLSGLNIVIGGDLKNGRTARSLAKLLSRYPDNVISFVSTPELQIGEDIKTKLTEDGTRFEETSEMLEALRHANVVYWTRLQLERMEGNGLSVGQDQFVLDAAALEVMPKDARIMHPLPRTQEIPPSTDKDPRAIYHRQAGNGLYLRMALLDSLLRQPS